MADDATIATSSQNLHDAINARIKRGVPTFFKLEAQLPTQGRTNIPLASSQTMWVVLKTYASGGENELHAHPHEDHTFVILQGQPNSTVLIRKSALPRLAKVSCCRRGLSTGSM